MSNSADKVKMTSLDELLGVGSMAPADVKEGDIIRLPLTAMHSFKNHPFRVLQDEKMAETVESIRMYGVLVPGIVRSDGQGTYEIISGHRRHLASSLAGLADMPVIIKDLSDDEATVIMVDSNIQREDILPSEKAKALRMKYDALKRMDKISAGRNDDVLAKEMGESRNTIQRYIRLTYLNPELLQLVDEDKLPKITASELSYLKRDEQEQLLEIIQAQDCVPSGRQAVELKELSQAKKLTPAAMLHILVKKENADRVSFNTKKLRQFFPESYTGKQIEDIVYKLLKEWQDSQTHIL